MLNGDVIDLYSRVGLGTKIIVLQTKITLQSLRRRSRTRTLDLYSASISKSVW